VMVGAGHSNLIAINLLATSLPLNIEIILISDVAKAPYSGMLPGYLAGNYSEDEIVFDLEKLSLHYNFRLIIGEVIKIDTNANSIKLASGETIIYDCLSINTGIHPQKIEGNEESNEHLIYVKPLSHLIPKWKKIVGRNENDLNFAVVGAGSAGCEVATAITLRRMGKVTLFTRGPQILPELGPGARNKVENQLSKLNIQVRTHSNINSLNSNTLMLNNGQSYQFDYVFITTGAQPNHILGDLTCDEKGFIITNKYLLASEKNNVFASGDCISFDKNPLPKAGVFAVRQGPILASNIQAYLDSHPMTEYRPQKEFLKILLIGDEMALAVRGNKSLKGYFSWKLKEYLDRKFMNKYQKL